MKSTLSFDMNEPDEREQHKMCIKASDMACALSDIRQSMLRPARKHGWTDEYLNKINDDNPELFGKLESLFNQICEQHEVMEYT